MMAAGVGGGGVREMWGKMEKKENVDRGKRRNGFWEGKITGIEGKNM